MKSSLEICLPRRLSSRAAWLAASLTAKKVADAREGWPRPTRPDAEVRRRPIKPLHDRDRRCDKKRPVRLPTQPRPDERAAMLHHRTPPRRSGQDTKRDGDRRLSRHRQRHQESGQRGFRHHAKAANATADAVKQPRRRQRKMAAQPRTPNQEPQSKTPQQEN